MLKDRLLLFIWQHIWLTISLLIMTLGVALCIRSQLGSSVISSIPLAFTLAGEAGLSLRLTVGEYTNLMNIALVGFQILILRRRFQPVQMFQLIIGFLFGLFIDFNMAVTSIFPYGSMLNCCLAQIVGCTVLGFGISMEIRCGSITMPGEGITVAISKVSGLPFPKTKIIVDVSLVVIAVMLGYMFFCIWLEQVIGFGTLFAMLYVGFIVKHLDPHMSWFDNLLGYRPGFRRYVYGLARYMRRKGIYR